MRKRTFTRSSALVPLALGRATFNAAVGELPKKILIAKWGKNTARSQGQEFIVGQQTLKVLEAEQARRGWDAVALDYEHQSVPGHPNYKDHPREYAAKNGRVEVVEGEGLFYIPGEYTPSGQQHASSYQDVSGYFMLDPKTREVVAVKSVALCEHGDVAGAEFIEAAIAAAAIGEMPEEIFNILTFAKDLLELEDDADAEDIAEGLEALLREKNQVSPKSNTKSNTMDAETKAAIDKLAEQNNEVSKQIASLTTSLTSLVATQTVNQHNQEVEAVLAAAVNEGKVVPDSIKAKDDSGRYVLTASAIADVVKAIPATEPVDFSTPTHVAAAQKHQVASAEKEVALALGLTDEAMKKDTPMRRGNAPQGQLARALATA